MKQEKQSFCVTPKVISMREKDRAQPVIPYVVSLIMVDKSFILNTEVFVLVSAKSNARSCFKGSLKTATLTYLAYIML